jgi:hypothetical protein
MHVLEHVNLRNWLFNSLHLRKPHVYNAALHPADVKLYH